MCAWQVGGAFGASISGRRSVPERPSIWRAIRSGGDRTCCLDRAHARYRRAAVGSRLPARVRTGVSSRGSRTRRGVGSRSSFLRIHGVSLPPPLPSAAALRDESTFAGGFVGRERLGSGAGLVTGKLRSLVPRGVGMAGPSVQGACRGTAYLRVAGLPMGALVNRGVTP